MICPNCGTFLEPNARYCYNCGSIFVDDNGRPIYNTGNMPNNIANADKNSVPNFNGNTNNNINTNFNGNEPSGNKNNGKAKTAIICTCILLAAIIIAVATFFIVKFAVQKNDNNKASIQYATFTQNDLVNNEGIFDVEDEEHNENGVITYQLCDYDDNKLDNMLIISAKDCYVDAKVHEGIKTLNLSVYDYNSTVDKMDSMDVDTILSPGGNGVITAYSVKYQGKQYIVVEQLYTVDKSIYRADVYELTDGVFSVAGNIVLSNNGTEDECAYYVTTSKAPADYQTYPDDTDYSDIADDVISDLEDCSLAYYATYDNDVKFDKYYQSEMDALIAFFNCFGIDKSDEVSVNSQDFTALATYINNKHIDRSITPIYSYAFESSDSGDESTFDYAIADYSDLKEFLTKAEDEGETTTAEDDSDSYTELDASDEDVSNLIKTLNFNNNQYINNQIYDTGGFKTSDLSNEQILQFGMATIKVDDMTFSEDFDGYGYPQTFTKKQMKTGVNKLFGDIDYKNESFTAYDEDGKFVSYANFLLPKVTYSNGIYKAEHYEGGGGDMPFITQNFDTAKKYDDRMEIYVKTAFVDTDYNDSTDDFEYVYYKSYDNGFKDKIGSTAYTNSKYPQTMDKECIKDAQKFLNDMDTYCYTFKKDSNGKYCLYSFGKANSNSKSTDTTKKSKPKTTKATTKKQTTTKKKSDIKSAYKKALDKYTDKFFSGDTAVVTQEPEYMLYDINDDGTKELIIHSIKSLQENEYDFYTYKNGKIVHLGNVEEPRIALHTPKSDDGIYITSDDSLGASDAYYLTIDKITISGSKIKRTNKVNKAIDYDNRDSEASKYYGSDPVTYSYNDYSGINNL